MKLNCQKGDLCRIIAAGPFRDKFIIVTEMEMYRGRPTWKYQGPLLSYMFYEAWAFYDDTLRPIRDPGEDAVDETLLWVPVKNMEPA